MWQTTDNGMVFSADEWRIRVDNSGVVTVSTSDRDIDEVTLDDYDFSIAGSSNGKGWYWAEIREVMGVFMAVWKMARAAGDL